MDKGIGGRAVGGRDGSGCTAVGGAHFSGKGAASTPSGHTAWAALALALAKRQQTVSMCHAGKRENRTYAQFVVATGRFIFMLDLRCQPNLHPICQGKERPACHAALERHVGCL